MGETLLYLVGGLFVAASVWLARAAVRTLREARVNYQMREWGLAQLERALKQIDSDDEDEILAGLQVLAMLKDPGIRFKALPRLSGLAKSNNPHISRYAEVAIKKLISSVEQDSAERPAEEDGRPGGDGA